MTTETDKLPTVNMDELKRLAIAQALRDHGGNRTQAAKALGRSVRWVRSMAGELGLPEAVQNFPSANETHAVL